jgi:hypothetical protein
MCILLAAVSLPLCRPEETLQLKVNFKARTIFFAVWAFSFEVFAVI